jgi:uncharacterized repeat protein (TIGR01451 family)
MELIPDADAADVAGAPGAADSTFDAVPADQAGDRFRGPAGDRFAGPGFSIPSPDETIMRGNDGGEVVQASADVPASGDPATSSRNSRFGEPQPSRPSFDLPSFPPDDRTQLPAEPQAPASSDDPPSPIGAPPAPLTDSVPGPPEPLETPKAAAPIAADTLRQPAQAAISDIQSETGNDDDFDQPPTTFGVTDTQSQSPRFDAPSQTPAPNNSTAPSVYGNQTYGDRDSSAELEPLRPGGESSTRQFSQPSTTSDFPSPSAGYADMAAELSTLEGSGVPGAETIEGLQSPSLSVEKTAPPEIQVGKETEFEIVIRNTGPVAATDVVVMDDVPRGTRFVNATPAATRTADGRLMWQIGTLQPGDERVVEIQLLPVAEGEIGSVAQVLFQSKASVRTVCTKPELTIKHVGPQKVLIGETLTFDITVTNTGTGAAEGVILEEDVPEGLVHAAGRELEQNLGTLRPGETRQVRLTLTADRPGVIQNVVLVRGEGNLFAKDALDLEVIAPDLQVAITGPRLRYLERPATYEISIANPGTAPAREVELVTRLDKGMKFISADHQGEYEPQNHAVYWSVEEVPAQQSGVAKLTLLPLETGEQTLRVEGRAELGLQHTHETTVRVESLAELQFTIADEHDPIEVDAETTYLITLNNSGSSAATDVRLTIGLSEGLKAVGGDGPTRVLVEGGRFTVDPLARLGAGEEAVYKIRVQGVADGPQRFQAQMVTAETAVPVTKEEITRVYSDK